MTRFAGTLAVSRDHGHHAAYPGSIDSSDNATIAAMMARLPGLAPKQYAASGRRGDGNPYSAAAVRGRPTKPVASPKRSTMTAGRSFSRCVTQPPERTAQRS